MKKGGWLNGKAITAGLVGGVVTNAVLSVIYMIPFVRDLVFHPGMQSRIFIELSAGRDWAFSLGGLTLLYIIHGIIFNNYSAAIPGKTWRDKGTNYGILIWLMYWVFQEWWMHHTLLGVPASLALLDLGLLLIGSIAGGMAIAWVVMSTGRSRSRGRKPARRKAPARKSTRGRPRKK